MVDMNLLRFTALLLALPAIVSAVDITMTLFYRVDGIGGFGLHGRPRVEYTCTNIPPGECCKPHAVLLPTLRGFGSTTVVTSYLQANQLAAAWTADSSSTLSLNVIECAGIPAVRYSGPGILLRTVPALEDLRFDAAHEELLFAASWVDLRTRFPPGSSETRYLQWQGVRGLIWGKNTWSAASEGIPFPKRAVGQRLDDWSPHGTAYIQAPRRWRYPTLYSINGTNYTALGNGLYASRYGNSLNLTSLSPLTI